ncbi:hypothetical protein OESDEN_13024 [Oesophagostomum dentatum]|uniref:Uncharacterized protein n=1 Tax=Oesophagostomum dentatum TaxID=61180 RepID=A0A0B1SVK9_OESDE|nr:hypothetical protein OESDEN_13024 [Oesophagostomum dentatum]
MNDWTIHLNPKYGGIEGDEPWRFHPYLNGIVRDDKAEKTPIISKEPSRTNWTFILFVLSLVALLQAILAVGSYSDTARFLHKK